MYTQVCTACMCTHVSKCVDMRLGTRVMVRHVRRPWDDMQYTAEELKNKVIGLYLHMCLPEDKYRTPQHSEEVHELKKKEPLLPKIWGRE